MKLFITILAIATAAAADYVCVKNNAHLNGKIRRIFKGLVHQRAQKHIDIAKVDRYYDVQRCNSWLQFWTRRALCIEIEAIGLDLKDELADINNDIQLWEQYCSRFNN